MSPSKILGNILTGIRRHNQATILPVILLAIVLLSCQNESGTNSTRTPIGKEWSGRVATAIDYGAAHNNALNSVANGYTQGDFTTFTTASADSSWNKLYALVMPSLVNDGLDTSGLSSVISLITSDQFTTWWPDSVVRPSTGYPSYLSFLNNRSAVERVFLWMDSTDPSTLTKLQYKNAITAICDSLLNALSSQSWVETEEAFIQVVRSSATYWFTFNNSTWGGVIPNTKTCAAAVQADAAGFLVTWILVAGAQVAQDGHFTASPVGGTMCSHEKQRISASMTGAATTSAGGITKIAGGLVSWVNKLWK